MDDLQNLPEAQRIDYAPAQAKKHFPWMLLFASPFLAVGAGFGMGGLLMAAQVFREAAMLGAIGVGFLTLGGMLVLVHVRWK